MAACRAPTLLPRMFSTIGGVARSVVIYVLLQSVTSYPASRTSTRQVQCLSRCLLLGIRHSYYDVSTCHTICDHQQGDAANADDESSNDVAKTASSRTESNMGRIMEILDEIDPAGRTGCGDNVNAKWDLKYEKKTEYKQLTLPVVEKRRWGSTIVPCIAAHCAGRTGPSRTACIVKMCNRKRDGKFDE